MTAEHTNTPEGPRRTFIEEARREQIVNCAIEVIAEHGYSVASLSRIAERAGISKGVITYHFDGKDDLIYQLLIDYESAEKAFIFSHVEAQSTAADALETYLRKNIEYMAVHPKHLKAVVEIVTSAHDSQGERKFDITSVEWMEGEILRLIDILEWGQKTGQFRAFTARVMAISIRGAIEKIAMFILNYPEIDVHLYAQELTEMFMRATQASASGQNESESRKDNG